ncbi:RNA 2'-phosphotransferase [Flavobacterium sp.]|uniref:RNA 2'-phosphotransferase n=1 Tax=Flavobacterium sp. TaxID=239 RepID=UPI0026057014|nr:RNA 2'-phosphotransferase [Flavobacterium sp.]
MTEEHKKRISKFLSLLLRHQPEKIGLQLDENGWANVEELIEKSAAKNYIFTNEELEEIVATNDKKRFAFNTDQSKIRASQGHSLDIELALETQIPPEFLFHGTAEKFERAIRTEGIKKMNRQHVHLSQNQETAHKVGSRHGKPVILTILSGQMHNEGIAFYQSENGVWLTDFVDPKYISK